MKIKKKIFSTLVYFCVRAKRIKNTKRETLMVINDIFV